MSLKLDIIKNFHKDSFKDRESVIKSLRTCLDINDTDSFNIVLDIYIDMEAHERAKEQIAMSSMQIQAKTLKRFF